MVHKIIESISSIDTIEMHMYIAHMFTLKKGKGLQNYTSFASRNTKCKPCCWIFAWCTMYVNACYNHHDNLLQGPSWFFDRGAISLAKWSAAPLTWIIWGQTHPLPFSKWKLSKTAGRTAIPVLPHRQQKTPIYLGDYWTPLSYIPYIPVYNPSQASGEVCAWRAVSPGNLLSAAVNAGRDRSAFLRWFIAYQSLLSWLVISFVFGD